MTWYVVDGMDGAGKSTGARAIRDHLESQGRSVAVITHPNRSTVSGRLASAFLLKEGKLAVILSTVFYVLDILGSIWRMRHGLRGYDDIVFVRYILAVSYLPEGLSRRLYSMISEVLPMPDVSIFVDVDAETAMGRILSRGDELEMFENIEKLARTREKMLALTEDWIVIDNTGSMEDSDAQLLREVFGVSDRWV